MSINRLNWNRKNTLFRSEFSIKTNILHRKNTYILCFQPNIINLKKVNTPPPTVVHTLSRILHMYTTDDSETRRESTSPTIVARQKKYLRGVSGVWAGWAIAHPVFGKIEGAAGQWRRTALLLVLPVLGSYLRPCILMYS